MFCLANVLEILLGLVPTGFIRERYVDEDELHFDYICYSVERLLIIRNTNAFPHLHNVVQMLE